MEEINRKKRRFGPAPKPADQLRDFCVGVYLSPRELEIMAARAGCPVPARMKGSKSGGDPARRKVSAYLRHAALGSLPQIIPELNREAWISLSSAAANLNQIVKRRNSAPPLPLDKIIHNLVSQGYNTPASLAVALEKEGAVILSTEISDALANFRAALLGVTK